MNNEIVVRSFSDLKSYFEAKEHDNLIYLNNEFINRLDYNDDNQSNNFDKINNNNILSTVNVLTTTSQLGSGGSRLQAVLTPEKRTALKNGTAHLCSFHKNGEIFPKFVYASGKSEFISLESIQKLPNFANIMMTLNMMQMQQTLQSIHELLMDFIQETNRQLERLIRDHHDNHMNFVETVKLDFETFLKENNADYRNFLLHSINEAFPVVCQDIKNNLKDLQIIYDQIEKVHSVENMHDLMVKQDNLINYIQEGIYGLIVLSNIELYIEYERNKDKPIVEQNDSLFTIQDKYLNFFVNNFTEKRLNLLSDLCYLPDKHSKNVWQEMKQSIKQIKQIKKEKLLCQNNVQANIMAKG